MEFKDYYSLLGVSKTATEKEIKQAFRKLARKSHPDVNPGDTAAESRFKEINEAYEVLGDPAKRKKYDELGANWRAYENVPPGAAGSPFGGGAPFGGQWSTGGSGGGFRPMTEEEVSEMFGGGGGRSDSPFSDFFRTFFGGLDDEETSAGPRRGRGRVRNVRGQDIEHQFELDLEDALRGSVQRLMLRTDSATRNVEVRIPAGVTDGSRVRVPGEGGPGMGSGQSGDLYLRIKLRPHPVFTVQGRDVSTQVRVPVTTAVLGGEVDVVTPEGKPLRLKLPPGTQPGQRFRLKGHGLPSVGKPDERGDLYATIKVEIPRTLTPTERDHYEAIRKAQQS
jgi:DnaJ-class molecular chaperone